MAGPRRSSTAGASSAQLDSLPLHLKLLLAQAVWENGTGKWKEVVAMLDKQASLAKVKPVLKADSAMKAYGAMLAEAELDPSASFASHAPELHAIAEKYYNERISNLHELMQQEAHKFRAAYIDLSDIQSGKWDDRRPGASPALPDSLPPLPITSPAPPPPASTKGKSPKAAAVPLPPTTAKPTSSATPSKSPKLAAKEEKPPAAAEAKMTRSNSSKSIKAQADSSKSPAARRRSGRGKADEDGDVQMEVDP